VQCTGLGCKYVQQEVPFVTIWQRDRQFPQVLDAFTPGEPDANLFGVPESSRSAPLGDEYPALTPFSQESGRSVIEDGSSMDVMCLQHRLIRKSHQCDFGPLDLRPVGRSQLCHTMRISLRIFSSVFRSTKNHHRMRTLLAYRAQANEAESIG